MSSNAPGPRPRQVTIGGWVVAIASAMLVASVFDSMARVRSVDTRDELTRVLTTGSAKDLGISVTDALDVVRAALFVAGTAGAITAILGIFVLQRHAAARIVLTIAAVPLVLTSPFSGGFLPILVAGGTALLWSRPARDWFAGRAPAPRVVRPAPVPRERSDVRTPGRPAAWAPPTITPPRPDVTPGASTPPPTSGWGRRATVRPAYAPPQPLPPAPGEVPKQVRIAGILTWVFSLVTAGLYALIAVALLADRGGMLKLLRDNPTVRDSKLSDDELVTVIVVVAALIILWCLAACVLAFLAWRRHAWAWILLMVSLGPAFVVELAAFPYSLLHLAAAAISLRMLLMPSVREWFRGADHGTTPPSAGWSPPPSWGPPTGWAPAPRPPSGGHDPEAPDQAPDQAPDAEPPAPQDEQRPRMPSGKPPVW